MADEVSRLSLAVDSRSVRSATGDLDKMAAAGGRAEKSAGGLAGAFRGLRAVLGPVAAALSVREIIRAADGYQQLNARIKLATKSVQEFATAQREVFAIAQRSGTGLDSVGNLYASLSRATQSLGVSQADLLGVVESINQALVISGGSAESAQAALVQLGQGFASGALRGEELNSVLEQAPRLAQAIADGLGVPIGQLRKLGEQGELTAEKVFGALQKSAGRLQVEFQQVPLTIGRATQQAGNALSVLIGAADEATGASGGLAKAISSVADVIGEFAGEVRKAASNDSGAGFLAQVFITLSRTAQEVAARISYAFKAVGVTIAGVAAQINAIREQGFVGALKSAPTIADSVKEDLDKARKELDKFLRDLNSPKFQNIAGGGRGVAADPRLIGATPKKETVGYIPQMSGTAGSKPTKAGKADKFTGLSYDEQIKQSVGNLLEESDLTKAKVYADTLKQLDELFYKGAISGELYDSAIKKLTGSTAEAGQKSKELTDAERRVYDEMQRLSELLASTESAGVEEQRRDMELLTKALQDGLITEQEYLEAVSARLNLVAEKTKEAKSFAEEFGATFSSAFEDAVIEGKNLQGVLQGLAQDILRITLRKTITEPLGLALGKGLDGLFGGFRASGGPVELGKSYVVGEEGPELFTPNTAGKITPNGAMGSSQSITININPIIGDVASQQDVVAGMQTVRAQILGDLQRSARYGGALAA